MPQLCATMLALLVQQAGSALLSAPTVAPSRIASAVGLRVTLQRACPIMYEEGEEELVMDEAVAKMKKSLSSCVDSLATLRVGRATPDMLDRVQVDYYGMPTPLNTLASVSTPKPTHGRAISAAASASTVGTRIYAGRVSGRSRALSLKATDGSSFAST